MDNKGFDDIIKSKLESHTDTSTPSGAEMSRMMESLPSVNGGMASQSVTTLTKVLVATSTILTIVLLYFIYRTVQLEDRIGSLHYQLEGLDLPVLEALPKHQAVYYTDTVILDSLNSASIRLQGQLDDLKREQQALAGLYKTTHPQRIVPSPVAHMTTGGSQAIDTLILHILNRLLSDPDFARTLMASVAPNTSPDTSALTAPIPGQTSASQHQAHPVDQLSAKEVKSILLKLAENPSDQALLANIINGQDPSIPADDQLSISHIRILTDLSDVESKHVLGEVMASRPYAVAQASKESDLTPASSRVLADHLVKMGVDPEATTDRLRLPYQDNEQIRIAQYQEKKRSWWLSSGPGMGVVPTEALGNRPVFTYKVATAYRPVQPLEILLGAEYYATKGESYDLQSIDFSLFDNMTQTEIENIKELKVALQWLDIPLETRFYLMPDNKLAPYVTVAVRARKYLKESYRFETMTEGYLNPSYSSESLVIPSYSYGIGARWQFNSRFLGVFQLGHSIGGEEIGLFEDRLNTIQAQTTLQFRLDK